MGKNEAGTVMEKSIFIDTKILFVLYSLLLIFDLILVINNPSYLGWIVVGFLFGLILGIIPSNYFLNKNNKLINNIFKSWEKTIDRNKFLITEIEMLNKKEKKKNE